MRLETPSQLQDCMADGLYNAFDITWNCLNAQYVVYTEIQTTVHHGMSVVYYGTLCCMCSVEVHAVTWCNMLRFTEHCVFSVAVYAAPWCFMLHLSTTNKQ